MIKTISKIVYGKEYKDKLDEKILNNKILWFMIMLMLIWNTSLTIGYMSVKKNNKVVAEFPSSEFIKGKLEVGNDWANDEYFLAWSMFKLSKLSNFDKHSISNKIDDFSNKLLYDRYIKLRKTFNRFVENVKKNKLKSNFQAYSDSWKVTSRSKNSLGTEVVTVKVIGEVINKISTFDSKRKKCEYTISMFRKGGKLYNEDFNSTCF